MMVPGSSFSTVQRRQSPQSGASCLQTLAQFTEGHAAKTDFFTSLWIRLTSPAGLGLGLLKYCKSALLRNLFQQYEGPSLLLCSRWKTKLANAKNHFFLSILKRVNIDHMMVNCSFEQIFSTGDDGEWLIKFRYDGIVFLIKVWSIND